MKNTAGAIIIGGHFQGLGVVRALGRCGIETIVLDKEPCIASRSRYCKKFYRTPDILDQEAYLGFLLQLADQKGVSGWVLYPTDDETVAFLAKNKPVLETYFRLFTPAWDIVKFAYDKKLSYQLAASLGIPVPATAYPECEKDLQDLDIPFPVIVKPAVMRDFFRKTGKKVFRASDPVQLREKYREACTIIDPEQVLIQEEIPDVAQNLYSFCPFFKNGISAAEIAAQRIRQHPMDFGQATTYAVSRRVPELKRIAEIILKKIDFYGLAEVEFIRDPRDGIYKFLEINPRIWGWHTLAVKAGVNLPLLVFQDLTGIDIPDNSGFKEGVSWIRLLTDVPTSIAEIGKGRMKPADVIKTYRGEKEFAVLAGDDPLPFIAEVFLLPYLFIKRGF